MKSIKGEEGSVLIIVLIVLISLATFSIAFFITSNSNLLTVYNEIKGEKLYFTAESGARLAIQKYNEETPVAGVLSWQEVYEEPSGFATLIAGNVQYSDDEKYNYWGGYRDISSSEAKILGKGILNKGNKSFIKRILVTIKVGESDTDESSPIVNVGNRIASSSLAESIADPETDVIKVVQTGEKDREEGGVLEINKTGPNGGLTIQGTYKPTQGIVGGETGNPPWGIGWWRRNVLVAEARPLVKKTIIINTDNVTIEGLWIEPPDDAPLISEYDPTLSSAEIITDCYVVNLNDELVTDYPDKTCRPLGSAYTILPVPRHEKAVIIVNADNVTIRNNLIVRKDSSYDVGIYVMPGVKNLNIEHNTFVNIFDLDNLFFNIFPNTNCRAYNRSDYRDVNSSSPGNSAIVLNDKDNDITAEIRDNIFGICRDRRLLSSAFNERFKYTIGIEALGRRDISRKDRIICRNNNFYHNLIALANLIGEDHLSVDPEFVSWENGIFTLRTTSPLKGMGIDGKDIGIDYDDEIFNRLTIVNYDIPENFESLREALKYAVNEERIKVEKNLIPVTLEYDTALVEIPQNNIGIYSDIGPEEYTRIPYIIDITGKGVRIDGLKFHLTPWAENYYLSQGWGRYGVGVINIGMKYLINGPLRRWNKAYAYISNSIIIRSSTHKIAGISAGYMETTSLSNLVVTSLGEPAMGDGIRFIDGNNQFFSGLSEGTFEITHSIIAGYINTSLRNNHMIAGISTSTLYETCSACSIEPTNCDNSECGGLIICDDVNTLRHRPGSRRISISTSDIWGNECDIKYVSDGEISYDNVVSVNPGFRFDVPEDEQFYIGSPLTNCGCSFLMGIDWDKFTQ